MKRFSEQLKKKAHTLQLRASERRELRERLVSYMEYHPVPQDVKQTLETKDNETIASESFATVTFNFAHIARMIGGFAVLFLIVMPFAAERTVPGDVLYPVKVRFNEELRSTLTLSPYEKVAWETERLERRITEARLLASEGKLTPEVEAEVAEAVKEHSEAAQKEIASIREDDSEEAAIAEITFASALAVQSEVLVGHIENDTVASTTEEGHSIAILAGAVDEVLATAEATQDDTTVSYEKLFARIEIETTWAYEFFDSIDAIVSEEERTDIERRLADITIKIEDAVASQENAEVSIALLTEALTDTQKLISFMTNIDVRENVTVEALVPITLTDEERILHINERVETAKTAQTELEEGMDTIADEALEKVAVGLESLTAALTLASTSLAVEDFDAADEASISALSIVKDLKVFIKQFAVSEEVPEEVIEVPVDDIASSTEEVVDDSVEEAPADEVEMIEEAVDAVEVVTEGE